MQWTHALRRPAKNLKMYFQIYTDMCGQSLIEEKGDVNVISIIWIFLIVGASTSQGVAQQVTTGK